MLFKKQIEHMIKKFT